MLTLIFGTLILALTYGAFWHSEPAGRQTQQSRRDDSRFGRLLSRALDWLLLMPHPSYPVEQKEWGKRAIPRQTAFLRELSALRGRNRIEFTVPKKPLAFSPEPAGDSLWERIASALVLVLARRGIKGG